MTTTINISAEETALLKLSGLKPPADAGAALEAVVNFWRFAWLANEHGVAAFVRKNIDEAGIAGLVPATDYQGLRNQALRSIVRNSFIVTSLKEVVRILNEAGMTPMLLKGTALEFTVYGESGLRPMTDADILLPEDECLRAWKLLQEKGYTSLPLKSPLHRLILMHTGKHLPSLVKGGFSVEIHHRLFRAKGKRKKEKGKRKKGMVPPFSKLRLTKHGAWGIGLGKDFPGGAMPTEGASVLEISDPAGTVAVLIPSPGLHFLYLVTHLSKHEAEGHSQLRLYNDLAAMLQAYDAETVIYPALSLAKTIEQKNQVRNKLGLLNKYLEVALPAGVDAFIDIAEEVRFLHFLSNPKDNTRADKKTLYRESVRSIPGFHRKLIFVLGDIFPGIGFMKRRYGKKSALGVLPYYLLRPGKLWWMVKWGREKGVKGVEGVRDVVA